MSVSEIIAEQIHDITELSVSDSEKLAQVRALITAHIDEIEREIGPEFQELIGRFKSGGIYGAH